MATKFQVEISPMWSVIAEVKGKIKIAMKGMNESSIDFTSIVASELLENAIKFGVSSNRIPQVSLEFVLDNGFVFIKVINEVNQGANLIKFKETMGRIKVTENKKSLYLERLQEILDDPTQVGSHLGMYRIVSESEFDLDFRLDDNILEIIATRQFKDG